MIKMVVSSFLNTLVDDEDAIPTSTMFEFDRLKSSGIILTILSNRLLDDVLFYNNSYPFIQYVIALNGGIIFDVENDTMLFEKAISNDVIRTVQKCFSDYRILYYSKEKVLDRYFDDNIIKMEIKISKNDFKKIDALRELGIICSILKIGKEYYLEINAISIVESLEILFHHLAITSHNVLAIIGNQSEEQLLEFIPECYVVSNAMKEVKTKAKKRTKSNTSKGVENVLKKIGNK